MAKRIKNAKGYLGESKSYTLEEAISFFTEVYRKRFSAKFDETIEFVSKLGVDPRQSDQVVRSSVVLPNNLGNVKRVALIVESSKLDEATKSEADEVGGEELIEKIRGGFLEFDVCVSTPGMMSKVSTLGRILGPKGLMPNPKLGTVSEDFLDAVKKVKQGQVTFKTDKNGIIHVGVAKIDFQNYKVRENIISLYKAILSVRPAKSKGNYIKAIFLSSTQGPSLMLDLKSLIV